MDTSDFQPTGALGPGLIAAILFLGTSTTAFCDSPVAAETPKDAVSQAGGGTAPLDQATGKETVKFDFATGLSLSQGYKDNIFATRNDKVDDFISIVSPELSLKGEAGSYDFEIFGSAEVGRYWQNSDEDYEDYAVGAVGRYAITPRNSVFGGVTHQFDHEPRSSADDVAGKKPTTFDSDQLHAGAYNRFGQVTTRIGGTFERLDFDDVDGQLGTINNDDRDRDLYTAGARVGYLLSPTHELFVQGSYDLRSYQSPSDDNGFNRDSQGFNAALGLRYRSGRTLDAEVLGGYLRQFYDDGALDDVGTVDFGARMDWHVARATNLSAFVDRTIQETTLAGASSYIDTGAGLSLEQRVRRDLELEMAVAYYISDYQGIDREDHVVSAALSARYFLTPNLYAGLDYRFTQRDSSIPNEDYDDNGVFLSIGAQIPPAYFADTPLGGEFDSGRSGAYLGAQVAYGNLGTELEGPRGSGGSLTADFADQGYGAGAFGGYGAVVGDWYLGLELDAEFSAIDWGHNRTPGGRKFGVDQDWSYGASGLLGYVLPDGQLLYSRFGGVLTDFHTEYLESGVSTPEDQTLVGLRLGAGIEAPIGDGVFVRLDYSYTAYEDYNVDSNAPGVDNFANNGSAVRAAIGYRFQELKDRGGAARRRTASDSFDGLYGGFQGGYGALGSDQESNRTGDEQRVAGFGDEGFTGGLFAGYGLTLSRLYLGVEGEGELSNAGWDHEREPVGRTYKIDKRHGFGGGLRAGIVFGGTTLLYGRAGIVRTNFRTKFDEGAEFVDRSDDLTGLRFGGGIEIALTESALLRMDYTFTDYDGYAFVLSDGSRESFENSESLFRVGVGYRF